MDDSSLDRMAALFREALALAREQREAFLDERCGGDETLKRELSSLLAQEDGDPAKPPARFLESGALGLHLGLDLPERLARQVAAESEGTEGAGEVLGDFRIIREIGRGAMGVVYEAEQKALDRTVALKVLPAHLTLQPLAVKRFRREAQMAARLHHKGIVQVHQVGSQQETHYFAMDFVEGAPLHLVLENLARHSPKKLDGELRGEAVGGAVRLSRHRRAADRTGPDPPETRSPPPAEEGVWRKPYVETVSRLVLQVAEALASAHRAGIIHRDIKPSNILVREDGSTVLTDFGLARPQGVPSLTATGEFAGTPAYVSPEQARGKDLDARTDVFSLGVTLYELLTLRRPFEAETTGELINKIERDEPVLPRRLNPSVPRDLETVCLTALEKDPARRYPDAGHLAADLQRFLEYRPVLARPIGLPTRIGRWVRRHPAPTAAIVLPVILVVAALWLFIATQQRSQALLTAQIAVLAGQRGDWQVVLKSVRQAIDLGHPDEIGLRILMIQALQGRFDDDAALAEIVRLDTRHDLGRRRAKVQLLKGIALAHSLEEPDAGKSLVRTALGSGELSPADDAFAKASLATRLPEQVSFFQKALHSDPYHHAARVALGHLLILLGRIDEARDQALTIRAIYPDDPMGRYLEAACLLFEKEGKRQAAEMAKQLEEEGYRGVAELLRIYSMVFGLCENADQAFRDALFADVKGRSISFNSTLRSLLPPIGYILISKFSGRLAHKGEKEGRGPNIQFLLPPNVVRDLAALPGILMNAVLGKVDSEWLSRCTAQMERTLDSYPSGGLYFLKGLLLWATGKVAAAEQDFGEAHRQPSLFRLARSPHYYELESQVEQFEGRNGAPATDRPAAGERAADTLRLILTWKKLDLEELDFLGHIAVRLGKVAPAAHIAGRIRATEAKHPEGLALQAWVDFEAGYLAGALEHCEAALEQDPHHDLAKPLLDRVRKAMER